MKDEEILKKTGGPNERGQKDAPNFRKPSNESYFCAGLSEKSD